MTTLRPLLVATLAFFSLISAGMGMTTAPATIRFETVELTGDPTGTICLAYKPDVPFKHPAILMLGSLQKGELPDWSTDLVSEGYMLAAFTINHPPDPDPSRRPQWLVFDERFAHGYVLGGSRAPHDAGRVIDYLVGRGDVNPQKIGWLGSSSTGIPGLSVAAREPRLAAIVAFVSTGAYRKWLETWHTNKLWVGKGNQLWPETERLLSTEDPILHVKGLYPKAVLMVSGGRDKVVDPATARAFVEAAEPFYKDDPSRLRLVIYDNFTHNLPADCVKMHAEQWFRLYMNPTADPPRPEGEPKSLSESVKRTQINAAGHDVVVGADKSAR